MKELTTLLTTIIEKSTPSFKIVSNHHRKIEIIPITNPTSLKSASIDVQERIATARFTMKLPQHEIKSPILILFTDSRLHVKHNDLSIKNTILEVMKNSQLDFIENNVGILQSIIIDIRNRNEIQTHFRFQDFPIDAKIWKDFFDFLEAWGKILDALLQNASKNIRKRFSMPTKNPKTLLENHPATIASSTITTLTRENPRRTSNVPEILRLVAARAENYEINSQSFQMKPITGAFQLITWSWLGETTNEACSRSITLTATGQLRNIDDGPPCEIMIQLQNYNDLIISGDDDHIIKELYEKEDNLRKISRLHNFGGKIHVKKNENRVITVTMHHGACQHDVEIAYGLLQDIGWTLEMAYYSDRLLTMK